MMAKKIYRVSAEKVNSQKKKWKLTFSKRVADIMCKGKKLYRLPNGVYACKKYRRK